MQKGLNKIATSLLVEMLPSIKSPVEQCNIICELTRRNVHSSSSKNAILNLKNSNDVFWNNYVVSDFALASLHLLRWEKYNGDRREIIQLIDSGLHFD